MGNRQESPLELNRLEHFLWKRYKKNIPEWRQIPIFKFISTNKEKKYCWRDPNTGQYKLWGRWKGYSGTLVTAEDLDVIIGSVESSESPESSELSVPERKRLYGELSIWQHISIFLYTKLKPFLKYKYPTLTFFAFVVFCVLLGIFYPPAVLILLAIPGVLGRFPAIVYAVLFAIDKLSIIWAHHYFEKSPKQKMLTIFLGIAAIALMAGAAYLAVTVGAPILLGGIGLTAINFTTLAGITAIFITAGAAITGAISGFLFGEFLLGIANSWIHRKNQEFKFDKLFILSNLREKELPNKLENNLNVHIDTLAEKIKTKEEDDLTKDLTKNIKLEGEDDRSEQNAENIQLQECRHCCNRAAFFPPQCHSSSGGITSSVDAHPDLVDAHLDKNWGRRIF